MQPAATDYAELNTVHQAMINDERVYVVVTAEVNIVIGADNDTVIEVGYTGLATELAPFVTELGSTARLDAAGRHHLSRDCSHCADHRPVD